MTDFLFVMAILMGILVIIGVFLSQELRTKPIILKIFAYVFTLGLGAVFIGLGASNLYIKYGYNPQYPIAEIAEKYFREHRKTPTQAIRLESLDTLTTICNNFGYLKFNRKKLFGTADADSNQQVSFAEFQNLLAQFDKNQDQKLDHQAEYLVFKAQFNDYGRQIKVSGSKGSCMSEKYVP